MLCFYTNSPEIFLNKTNYKTFLIGIKTYVALTLMVQRGQGQQTDPTNLIIYQSGHLINYQSGHLINYQSGHLINYQSGHLIIYQSGHLINYQFMNISKITF